MKHSASIITLCHFVLILLVFGCSPDKNLPPNNPKAFVAGGGSPDKKVVVAVGSSTTRGSAGFNWVDELAHRYRNHDLAFINAGVNGDLAYNVVQRIDEIVQCRPDIVTIMIGANDVLATLCEQCTQRYIEKGQLPQVPNHEWFVQNLNTIIIILKTQTHAQIVLLSLSPITEDYTHNAYRKAAKYSTTIKQIAQKYNLHYLPVYETMHRVITQRPHLSATEFEGHERYLVYKGYFFHHVLGISWNNISDDNGLWLQTDYIHLNRRGGMMIANLLEGYLKQHHQL